MARSYPAPRLSEPVCQRCTPMATAARSSALCLLVIALATGVSCSCQSAPSVTSISPSSTTAGGSPFVLTINGNDFSSDTVVNFNGSSLTPSLVNSHQLVATIPAADIAQPGTLQVFVLDPPRGARLAPLAGPDPQPQV